MSDLSVSSTPRPFRPPGETARRQLSPAGRYDGFPLVRALWARRSCREYSGREIDAHLLSELLWAACGVNGKQPDERTVPYCAHCRVIDVYVAGADGVWRYEPASHELLLHMSEDIRARTGGQDFVAAAPLNLIYVAHGERMTDVPDTERRLYACVDSAFIAQNVYLLCASQGLGTVLRGTLDTEALGRILGLEEGQFVTFAQSVGHPPA
jgi:nitroreductase